MPKLPQKTLLPSTIRGYRSRIVHDLQYVDPVACWPDIEPHLKTETVAAVLRRDFDVFTQDIHGVTFQEDQVPLDYQYLNAETQTKLQAFPFLNYVRIGACRFLVNFQLHLAQAYAPHRPWRIVSGIDHATVWDGEHLLFDFLAVAQSWPSALPFVMAGEGKKALPPGREAPVANVSLRPEVEFVARQNYWIEPWLRKAEQLNP